MHTLRQEHVGEGAIFLKKQVVATRQSEVQPLTEAQCKVVWWIALLRSVNDFYFIIIFFLITQIGLCRALHMSASTVNKFSDCFTRVFWTIGTEQSFRRQSCYPVNSKLVWKELNKPRTYPWSCKKYLLFPHTQYQQLNHQKYNFHGCHLCPNH